MLVANQIVHRRDADRWIDGAKSGTGAGCAPILTRDSIATDRDFASSASSSRAIASECRSRSRRKVLILCSWGTAATRAQGLTNSTPSS